MPLRLVRSPGARGGRLRARGRPRAAEPLLRKALARAEAGSPPDPRAVAAALNELGLLCKDLARYDEACALYRRALGLLAPHDDAARDVATLWHNLAGIAHARGDHARAAALARHGLAIRRESGDDATRVIADEVALAAILDEVGQHDEAAALYENALAYHAAHPLADPTDAAVALNGLGALCARRGELARAIELLECSAALKRRRLGPRHPDLALTLNNLAVACRRRGDLARAVALYRTARAILEHALGPDHPRTRGCRENEARCLTAPAP